MLPALLLLTLDAHAVTRQVGGGGAYNTIASAVAAAALGDTILITAGRYTESVSTRQNLTFEASGDVVWLEGASAALSTTNATVLVRGVRFEVNRQRCVDTTRGTVTLDGVTCTTSRGGQTALDGFGVRAVDTALTLVDTEIYDLQTTGFGGGVNIDGGSLTVTRGHLHDLSASRGGAVYANGTRVTIDGALFTANHAIGVGPTEWGGALSIVDPTALHVATSHFVHNQAYAGGDIDLSSTTRGAIEVLGNSFDTPVASGSGGALRFTEVSGAIIVTGNLFCEVYSSGDGGGALFRAADATWTNNVHIGAYAPGGGGALFVEDSTLTVVNNTFVDLYGHLGGAVDAQGGAVVDFRNNLVAYVGDYDMITTLGGVVTPRWTALYQNDGAGVAHGPNAVLTDPRMILFTDDGLCNDDVRPAAGSPLINAGDPSIRDLDGSRSDIGAYGGPGAVWLAADADADGFAAPYDCDDLVAAVSPNAAEVCDGADNDCDGQVDAPANPAMPAWYFDQDGDGYGTPLTMIRGCTAQPGYVATADDCDDRRSGVHPGAPESCDGADEDCNGAVDDGTPVAGPLWYVDGDGDGHGGGAPVIACTQPAGLVALGDDCDDVVADAYPGAMELCNGLDDDCDRQIDEGNPTPGTWYTDSDADGHGDPATSLVTCAPPAGWVGRPDDCDDHDDLIFPGAAEHCDGVDEDCDEVVDEDPVDGQPLYADLDGDRWGGAKITACRGADGAVQAFGDCDDADDRRHPGAQERCNDNDLDCDGLPGNADGDSDGFAACDDCDDANADAFPGAPDAPYDGELLDCDRVSDNDADGDGVDDVGHNGLDCDDADPAVFPGASEPATSTVDLDCDGVAGVPVVAAPEEDAGCACDAGGGGSAWWWLVAAGLVRRRR